MVTSLGHFISWVMEIVVFGGIEYVVTLHGGDNDACPIAKWMFIHLVPRDQLYKNRSSGKTDSQ